MVCEQSHRYMDFHVLSSSLRNCIKTFWASEQTQSALTHICVYFNDGLLTEKFCCSIPYLRVYIACFWLYPSFYLATKWPVLLSMSHTHTCRSCLMSK